jgi:toxin ParE1/3/4
VAASIVFDDAAVRDLQDAANWYEHRQRGLGARFVNDVDLTVQRISAYPMIAPAWPEIASLRKALTSTFPFAVVYSFANNIVRVVAVAHTSRDPNSFRLR